MINSFDMESRSEGKRSSWSPAQNRAAQPMDDMKLPQDMDSAFRLTIGAENANATIIPTRIIANILMCRLIMPFSAAHLVSPPLRELHLRPVQFTI